VTPSSTRGILNPMARPTQEWFLVLDDRLRMVGPRGYPNPTAAISAANHQAPWPAVRGRLVVRSDHDEGGVKVGDGAGRVVATREDGRWSGPDVVAGDGYLVDSGLNEAHERRHNLRADPAKTSAQLEREIVESLARPARPRGAGVAAIATRKSPRRGWDLTEELARALPRFEFIAHWLAVVTRKKGSRGPLGLYVRRAGKRWQIVSPVGGGTVTYETTDPALLFDYARRGQLGRDIRDAEEFRGLAHRSSAQ
jgi:hypothetical protein